MPGLAFDDDIRNMRSPGNRASSSATEVMAAFGLRFSPMMVRVDGRDRARGHRSARASSCRRSRRWSTGRPSPASTPSPGRAACGRAARPVIERLRRQRGQLDGVEERFAASPCRLPVSARRRSGRGRPLGRRARRATRRWPCPTWPAPPLERVVNRYVVRLRRRVLDRRLLLPAGRALAPRSAARAGRAGRPPPVERLLAPARTWSRPSCAGSCGATSPGDVARPGAGAVCCCGPTWVRRRRALLAMVPTALGLVWMLGAMAAARPTRVNFINIFVDHHDHRDRRRLRRPPPPPVAGGGRRNGGAGGDGQGDRRRRPDHHGRLRVAGHLPLPRPAVGRGRRAPGHGVHRPCSASRCCPRFSRGGGEWEAEATTVAARRTNAPPS